MIPAGLEPIVKRFEGFHRVATRVPVVTAVPYLCPANFWTIGWGILCQADHPPITQAEGDAMLAGVLPSYVNHALRLSPLLAQPEHESKLAAISDFVFNLGPTQYAASTLRKRVNERNWNSAAVEIRRWVYGGGRKLPGLVTRREAEVELLLT